MTPIAIGILAHVDAGKTTLSEGLLFESGTIRGLGRVDRRDAFLDTDEQERERGITIFSKQARMKWGERDVTLVDTPGHVDFSTEMERTLQVLDYCILVISGADGVQSHTRTLWKLLDQYRIPTFIFVNKMDQVPEKKERLLAELGKELSSGCVDFSLENQSGEGMFDFDIDRVSFSEEVLEEIAMQDETVLEAYLEDSSSVTAEVIRDLILDRKLIPCYFGSALKVEGVRELMRGLAQFMTDPEYGEETSARVFKITRDEQGNRMTHLKVTGGKLEVRAFLGEEKISQIRLYSGEKYEAVSAAEAGTICAVLGLQSTFPGQGLGAEEGTNLPLLAPVLHYQLILPPEVDPVTILPGLRMLEEEDPQLQIVWDERLKEIQLMVMGEIQIQILKRQIEKRLGVKADFGPGHIVYKETVTAPVEGVGHFEPLRHYAEAHLLIEPGEMGSGIVIGADCSEDELAKNWQRLILTHVRERQHPGVLLGAPLTDVKITLVAGRAHIKHTEGGDFRQATYRAIRNGMMQALAQGNMQILEPFYSFRLELPTENVGRAMTDLEQRFAHFTLESSGEGERSVLTGAAPAVCLQDYGKEIAAYTGGRGELSCQLLGYGPCHNPGEVLEGSSYDPEADVRHPADSVFCSHGAGTVVPWYQVPELMHVDSGLGFLRAERVLAEQQALTERRGGTAEKAWVGTEEIDAILRRTFDANRKESKSGVKSWGRKTKPAVRIGDRKEPVYRGSSKMGPEYLLVDGYNVIFAWKELAELAQINIDSARDKLQDILCNYQAVRGCELILVFDAYRVKNHETEYFDYHNIHIVFTKEAETADQYIERFAHENGRKYKVTVVTSDGLEQIIIRGQGCGLISSREFEQEVERAGKRVHEDYQAGEKREKFYLLDGLSPEELEEIKKGSETDE